MVQICWHYNVFNDTNTSACEGPFENCAKKVECKPEGRDMSCFAFADIISNQGGGSEGTQKILRAAGCFENSGVPPCDPECLGSQRRQNDRYYCCCTSDGCNNNIIIPKITPPPAAPQPDQNSTSAPVLRSDPNFSYTLPVILIVLMTLATILIAATYLRRKGRFKRNNNGRNRSPDDGSLGSSDNVPMSNHRHELHDLRNNPEALTPFRNSFGNDEHNNFIYGQPQTHHNDNDFTNHATRLENNNNANNIATNNDVHLEAIDLKRIELLNVVGSGRFGTVHKANILMPEKTANSPSSEQTLPVAETSVATGESNDIEQREDIPKGENSEIAVKIIPNNELQSWKNELEIYSSPRTRHPNILKFLGYTVSPDTNSHWLLVEYASNGSLHHYLKENIVSWPQLISIALGIVRGLSHLHDGHIAHRDFKSKNVLLRHNLSPCITDFGVAAILDIRASGSHHEHRRKYLQVGTPRYMAPEVLECAVAFSIMSFTKIDVYALSLVIWELLSRCYPLPKPWGSDLDDSTLSDSLSHDDRKLMAARNLREPITSTPPRSPPKNHQLDQSGKQCYPSTPLSHAGDGVIEGTSTSLLGQVRSSSPRTSPGNDVIDGAPSSAHNSTNGFETSIDLSDIVAPVHHNRPAVPVYKMPFEDEVGLNPDIDIMRQAVLVEKLRPPIRSEWRFYPVSKVAQVIVDSWEHDQDARISTSCFVERIESLRQQEQMYQARIRRAQLAANSTQKASGDHNPDGQQKQPEPPPEASGISFTTIVA